tara:strand:- start:347 stop:709 length:363 start_codon:yes stop_codon:yes gene_type:complete
MVDLVVEEPDHIRWNGHKCIMILILSLQEVIRVLMVEKVVVDKEILVGMDGKDIQTLNPKWVLVAAVVVLAVLAVMLQVQLMDLLDIRIQTIHLLGIRGGMDKVDPVAMVELSLCLELLI